LRERLARGITASPRPIASGRRGGHRGIHGAAGEEEKSTKSSRRRQIARKEIIDERREVRAKGITGAEEWWLVCVSFV
jgi:hypothetical protein